MSKWKRITGGKNALRTLPLHLSGTYWHIASEGITPGVDDGNAHMTGGARSSGSRRKSRTSSPPKISNT